jgi:hypothetical protein
VKELNPDGMYLCDVIGAVPRPGNEWMIDYFRMIGEEVKGNDPLPYMWLTGGVPGWMDWMPLYVEKGVMGPGKPYCGWWIGPDMPYQEVYAYFREHDLYCVCSISDVAMLQGDMAAMEEAIKARAECAKLYPKHGLALGVVDYWTPPQYFDAALAMAKKYGRF